MLYGFLAFLIGRELRPAWRLPVALGAALLVLLIAFSRLYLGAHWLSDVIGGLAFGAAWLAALGISYLRKPPEPIGPVGLIVVVGMALAVAGAANVARRHALDIERYAAKADNADHARRGLVDRRLANAPGLSRRSRRRERKNR